MAVYIKTENSKELLGKLRKAIDEDKISTWKYDDDGDFYHSPEQWKYNGWFHPYTEETYLVFGIIGLKNENMSTLTYAIYHGRFIEMMLNHFDSEFSKIFASSQKTKYDRF